MAQWIGRCWALPVGLTLAAAGLKALFPQDSFIDLGVLCGCYAMMFLAVCWLAGLNRELVQTELAQVQRMFFKS